MVQLNQSLLIRQGVTPEACDTICFLHEVKDMIFEEMDKTDDIPQLKNLVEFLEEVEFGMQEGWNFPQDATKHTWWLRPKKCTCPFYDNVDRWGYSERIISGDCKLHG